MLYTVIVTMLFCMVMGGAYAASRVYSEGMIKEELVDEMDDFCQLLLKYPLYLQNTDQMTFFDDHILLSIYDEEMNYIDGVLHDELPKGIEFKENVIQTFHEGENSFYVYDTRITFLDGSVIWVRGIHTFNALGILFQRLMLLSAILLPLLIVLTAFIGYRMIKSSLRPVNEINQTVNEIIESSDLSLRLNMPLAKDEMYALSETFNHLLEHLEQQFLREQQFSSDAAHELRTPIATILSRCEYCLEELELTDELREELQKIRQKTLQTSALITDLLAIARAEGKRYQPVYEEVDLGILAETVIDELEEKASAKNITLEVQNETSEAVIFADMEMMMRMFINLVNNAICYGKENGFVRMIISEQEDSVILEFIDNGIGIEDKHLDKIWNRFYQADSSHSSEGFGLGLFMVNYIVKCHKGSISVTSTVGKGSEFTVILPRNILKEKY